MQIKTVNPMQMNTQLVDRQNEIVGPFKGYHLNRESENSKREFVHSYLERREYSSGGSRDIYSQHHSDSNVSQIQEMGHEQQIDAPFQRANSFHETKAKSVTICEEMNENIDLFQDEQEQILEQSEQNFELISLKERREQKFSDKQTTSQSSKNSVTYQRRKISIEEDEEVGLHLFRGSIKAFDTASTAFGRKRNYRQSNIQTQSQNVPVIKNRKVKSLKQFQSDGADRPQTVPEYNKQRDMKLKRQLRRNLNNQIRDGLLSEDNIVVEEIKKLIGSPQLRKIIKARRDKEEEKKINVEVDFTESVFGISNKNRCLRGLYTRQYHPSFFQDPNSQGFKDLIEQISNGIENDNSSLKKADLIDLLSYGSNQLFVLYDSREPVSIRNSRNRDTVLESISNKKTRVVGYAVFRVLPNDELSNLVVEKVEVRQYRKENKKKMILAFNQLMDRSRAKRLSLFVKQTDFDLYKGLGFQFSKENQSDLIEMGLIEQKDRRLMHKVTLLNTRDIKCQLWVDKQILLRKRAKKAKKYLEKYMAWIQDNEVDLTEQMSKKYRANAAKSDQAKTPHWIFKLVKSFTRLTDAQILDVFVYQEKWNERAFYNAFNRIWDPKYFHWVNPPFTQTLASLKKCLDFQASGGNCVMILPDISLLNCFLYRKFIKGTTVRVDLPLFAYDGYKDPLMKHCVLLYFLTPEFMSQLTALKEPRMIETQTIINDDQTKLVITHKPQALKSGASKQSFTVDEKELILDLFQDGKSMCHITKRLKKNKMRVKQFLKEQFGDCTVEAVLEARTQGMRPKQISQLIKGTSTQFI